MAAGETKELITYSRRGGGGGCVRSGGGGVASEKPQSGSKSSSRRSLHGFRATKQWVEDNALDSTAHITHNGSKKEGRVHFKQENTSFSPSPLLRKDVASEHQVALSPISLNSLPGFRPPLSTSKIPAVQESASDLTDAKILQQAVPCVRNEGGERKVVWCNPAFCADSEDRRFSNDSAAGATSASTFTSHHPLSSFSKPGDLGVVSQDLPDPPSQDVRRHSIINGQEEGDPEDPSSSSGLSKVDAEGGNYGSPEKYTSSGSPAFSISAVAGSSPATVMTSSIPEEKGRSLRAHFELESASGNWYTPVMSSLTPECVGNSRCLERLMMDVSRTRKTLAHMPAFKAASSSQAFFSSPAHPLCGASATAASPSTKDDTPGDSNRRKPSGAYKIDAPTTSEYYGCCERRSSRKLAIQQVIGASPPFRSDGKSVKSHRAGNRAGRPSTGGVDVTSSGAQKDQGPPPALQSDYEAMVEADLEADIAREIEEELAKEILILSTKLAQLHARQELRRVGWGEKSKVGHSCPQTPLRCAPSPAELSSASPAAAAALSAVQEEKQRPASESKRRSGRVVAAKFLQSAAERSKGSQSVDRSSRRQLLSDAPFLGPIHLPRRSLGTPARLLAKSKSARSSSCSPEQQHHRNTEQGMNPQSRSKVSAEEYVRERSSSGAGVNKSKSAVLKEVSRKDLEEARMDAASKNMERQQHHHARSLSMGSAVQSHYFPEFERKIDWVKTLRSETLPSTTAVPMNSIDDLIPKHICKDTQEIHAWLRENHGSVETEESSSEETLSLTIEPEPIHPAYPSPIPVERCDQSNDNTPQLDRRPAIHLLQGRAAAPAPFVARTPTPTKTSRPWTTPTRNTPSSAAAAAQSCSPSVRSRTVPSRYGTPVRSTPKTPGTNDKVVTDPKLLLESPVRKIDQTPRNDHTLRGSASASKEPGVSPGTRGRSLVRKPTIRKGYPGVAGLKSKAEVGAGGCGGDLDAHCSRHHHQHPSPSKTRDRKSLGGRGGNDCMKRKDNFEAEYEKFVESSEVVEKQVSELYHAAMENVSTAESSADLKAADPPNGKSSTARTAAAKHTYIRCVDLIKDESKNSFVLKAKRATGQSVLPPTDGQDSDDSVLARSIPRTESSAEQRFEDLTSEERSADGQQHVEVKLAGDLEAAVQKQVSRVDVTNDCHVRTQLWCEDTLSVERRSLPKVVARSGGVQDDDGERDSGSVRRIYDQQRVQPFSTNSRGQPQRDNDRLSPDEIDGLDLESFWCLVGELEGPIMITRP